MDLVAQGGLRRRRDEEHLVQARGPPVEGVDERQLLGHLVADRVAQARVVARSAGEAVQLRAAVDEAAHHVRAAVGELGALGEEQRFRHRDRCGPQPLVHAVLELERDRHEGTTGMVHPDDEPAVLVGLDHPARPRVARIGLVQRRDRGGAQPAGEVGTELDRIRPHAVPSTNVTRCSILERLSVDVGTRGSIRNGSLGSKWASRWPGARAAHRSHSRCRLGCAAVVGPHQACPTGEEDTR